MLMEGITLDTRGCICTPQINIFSSARARASSLLYFAFTYIVLYSIEKTNPRAKNDRVCPFLYNGIYSTHETIFLPDVLRLTGDNATNILSGLLNI